VPGETDLVILLRDMSPRLNPGAYVFVLAPGEPADAHPIVVVHEAEGTTWVLPREEADALGLAYEFVAAWITLEVHSALEAVGLTAAFARVLTDAGISANVVAGLHHDHIFVPHERAEDAVAALRGLAET
jgi:hypothetical protein